jgi:hypothetical protein
MHIQALARLVSGNCHGWPEAAPDWDRHRVMQELRQTRQRAESLSQQL